MGILLGREGVGDGSGLDPSAVADEEQEADGGGLPVGFGSGLS